MTETPERKALGDLLLAAQDVLSGMSEARTALGMVPSGPDDFVAMPLLQRLASRALLKCVEQLQDLLARSLRATLILEQIDPAGLSPRAIADRAEALGILPDSDRWSQLVRLRNQLVHEYPLPRLQQFARFVDAWDATDDLTSIAASVARHAEHSLNVRSDHERL